MKKTTFYINKPAKITRLIQQSCERDFDDLKADERADLSELCQATTQLAILHALVQSFGQIMHKREGHCLEDWKKLVYESGIAEVQRFKVDPCVKTLREAIVRATLLLFFLKYLMAHVGVIPVSGNTLQPVFDTRVLDEAVCNCKTQNKRAIVSVLLSG